MLLVINSNHSLFKIRFRFCFWVNHFVLNDVLRAVLYPLVVNHLV